MSSGHLDIQWGRYNYFYFPDATLNINLLLLRKFMSLFAAVDRVFD